MLVFVSKSIATQFLCLSITSVVHVSNSALTRGQCPDFFLLILLVVLWWNCPLFLFSIILYKLCRDENLTWFSYHKILLRKLQHQNGDVSLCVVVSLKIALDKGKLVSVHEQQIHTFCLWSALLLCFQEIVSSLTIKLLPCKKEDMQQTGQGECCRMIWRRVGL